MSIPHKSRLKISLTIIVLCFYIPSVNAGFLDKIKEIGRGIKEKTGDVRDAVVNGKEAKDDIDDIHSTLTYADTDSLNQTQVYQLQLGLNARGYEAGVADGKVGSKTRQAINRFQRDSGVEATGAMSLSLLQSVQSNSSVRASTPSATASGELSRAEWKTLQSELNNLGFNTGRPDGIPGKKTRTALKNYLTSQGAESNSSPRSALQRLTVKGSEHADQTVAIDSQIASNLGKSKTTRSVEPAANDGALNETALNETAYNVDLTRFTLKNGAVQLHRYAKNSAADRHLSHYGMLLDLKLKPAFDKSFEARSMHTRPSRALCLANYLLSDTDKDKYLDDKGTVIPVFRDKGSKQLALRFWKGDNEFANRRAHAAFIQDELPRFVDASKNVPTQVAVTSNFELGEYDFERQEFKLRYGASFSAKRPFNPGGIGLSGACKGNVEFAKNSEYLAIADSLKMAAAEAELLLEKLGNDRDSKIFQQTTYLDLRTQTDKYNQTRYVAEPVSAELYSGEDSSELTFTIARATKSKQYAVAYVGNQEIAASTDNTATEPTLAVSENGASSLDCGEDCSGTLQDTLALRRFGEYPATPGSLTALELDFSDLDKAELARYMDLLTISAWQKSGAELTTKQSDHISNVISLCLASRFLEPDDRFKYVTINKSKASSLDAGLGHWAGTDEFEKQRSRTAFVDTQWPKLQAALPSFPSKLAFVSNVKLGNYDFEKQSFPLIAPSYSSLRAHAGCGFDTDFKNTVTGLPETLDMSADDAEKLMLSIDELRPGRSQQVMPDKPFLFAVIQMHLTPSKVDTSRYRSKTIFDASVMKLSVFLDAELTNLVREWTLKTAAENTMIAADKSVEPKQKVVAVEPVQAVVAKEPTVDFSPRTLKLLGVSLDMTIAESLEAIESTLAGSDFSKINLEKLTQRSGLSVSPCEVKRQRVSSKLQKLRREFVRSQQHVCLEQGGDTASCSADKLLLNAEQTEKLAAEEKISLSELPAKCLLEEAVFVPYAGYDVNYGTELKDRVVLFSSADPSQSDRLVAVTRVLQDKTGNLDVLAKLNTAFEGNSYSESKSKRAKTVWFEDPVMQEKVVMQKDLRKLCNVAGVVGVDGRGKITRRFSQPCGKFASYLGSGGNHYILLVDSDHSAGVNAAREKLVAESEVDAASTVKF